MANTTSQNSQQRGNKGRDRTQVNGKPKASCEPKSGGEPKESCEPKLEGELGDNMVVQIVAAIKDLA